MFGWEDRVVEFRLFAPEDLLGVLRLCEAEGWPSFPPIRPERRGY
jgi:hypothetical protein